MLFNNLTTKKLLEIAGVDVTKGKAKLLVETGDLAELKGELRELRSELAGCNDDKIRDHIKQDIEKLVQKIKTKSGPV